ncbi:MAG: copper chaperone PCu(A)C [Gammaproteobacteria bacterium]|nr:MAG: copper chaperone PCu(A)C [Gammaproteobacteria bacterium]RLA51547.1 MAG: copper chaperone PCu(A)C [Gammaproteobacteria bacterium]HDY83842.1 copper chaperone PCu(A)C [Halieaceae bacterium]
MNKPWIAAVVAAFLSLPVAAQQSAVVELAGAWVRALPPTQTNTAAYLTLTNRGDTGITIVGASADLAGKVEFHTAREIDGYMHMEQLQDLPVAAGQSLQLAPGGTHLMLLGLARMPLSGETVHLCLELATGHEVCTVAEVRKTAGIMQAHIYHERQQK